MNINTKHDPGELLILKIVYNKKENIIEDNISAFINNINISSFDKEIIISYEIAIISNFYEKLDSFQIFFEQKDFDKILNKKIKYYECNEDEKRIFSFNAGKFIDLNTNETIYPLLISNGLMDEKTFLNEKIEHIMFFKDKKIHV